MGSLYVPPKFNVFDYVRCVPYAGGLTGITSRGQVVEIKRRHSSQPEYLVQYRDIVDCIWWYEHELEDDTEHSQARLI